MTMFWLGIIVLLAFLGYGVMMIYFSPQGEENADSESILWQRLLGFGLVIVAVFSLLCFVLKKG